jgi:hypothetical protein
MLQRYEINSYQLSEPTLELLIINILYRFSIQNIESNI